MRRLLLCVICLFPSLLIAENPWFTLKPVNPANLNRMVKETGLFKHAQLPVMKQTVLYSIGRDNQHYSVYKMNPLQFIGRVSRYRTHETVVEGKRFPGIASGEPAIIHGKGLSLGGLFWPKEQMVIRNKQKKLIYDNQIDITAIQPVSGHLFPLKVGNTLVFKFKRRHSRMFAGKTKVKLEQGWMTYKVIAKTNQFPYAHKPIPGPIYEVEVWEQTRTHPKPYLTDIYQYAKGLNWYISDKYFNKSNRLLAWYRVKTWS